MLTFKNDRLIITITTKESRLLPIEIRRRETMRSKDPELKDQICDYICDYYLEHERTPSTTEIGRAVGIARGTAYKYLVAMDEEGRLEYRDGQIRMDSMSRVMAGREKAAAVGQIPCGDPQEEEENVLYRTTLPTAVFGKGPFYLLRATGDSMEDAGIEDGDLLVIRRNAEPRVGDIIAALDENGESTLKRYGGIDEEQHKAVLEYQNRAVYGDRKILVSELVCQGVLSHIIKEV